jgi:hypothetical protein
MTSEHSGGHQIPAGCHYLVDRLPHRGNAFWMLITSKKENVAARNRRHNSALYGIGKVGPKVVKKKQACNIIASGSEDV